MPKQEVEKVPSCTISTRRQGVFNTRPMAMAIEFTRRCAGTPAWGRRRCAGPRPVAHDVQHGFE